MEEFLFSLLKIIVAVLLSLVSALVILRYYFAFKKQPLPVSSQDEQQRILLPLRLQACERIVLFLDRIAINNLIMRINRPEMRALQLQAALVGAIREEFEYNLSQQLYISTKAWGLVRNAKEETIRLINTASMKVPENASSSEMVRILLDLVLAEEKSAVEIAMEEVKKEIRKSF
ncbi:MAG: hypothetical protein NTW10_08210 [Bacteroidetes bacterium]|nr:hypothetical protein [Bacteroidota bacterium]